MYIKLKNLLYKLWNSEGRKVFHAFWQTFLGVFVLGVTGIVTSLLSTHNISDATSALLALVLAAAAAGFATVKAVYITKTQKV